MSYISDGCCIRIDIYLYVKIIEVDNYHYGRKQQGSFILQAEKVNGNCYYVLEGVMFTRGIWMCEDSWWVGELSDKGQCKGLFHALTISNPNISVQDYTLHWKDVIYLCGVNFKGNSIFLLQIIIITNS